MNIIIQHSSMVPIYEQIIDQFRGQIIKNKLIENDPLPSVRSLAKELNVSALTVKKAYDVLETSGLIVTVHGKGSFVAKLNPEIEKEHQQKEIQTGIESIVKKARHYGISNDDLLGLFKLLLEES
ncbi:GntR family transcriptional regulator [Paenibacillus herberti]|uniref:GntR family transcriptional regulator n=1 Tax=Paenibacillus herberti TaxID=1619309 RepID=A0A229P4I9_9BACL|nr:GntR family transcriptional regulator [Paenibacillus herberti]OXM17020.1 GntR family transcriptional regulator [Paenibacillus herberti]